MGKVIPIAAKRRPIDQFLVSRKVFSERREEFKEWCRELGYQDLDSIPEVQLEVILRTFRRDR